MGRYKSDYRLFTFSKRFLRRRDKKAAVFVTLFVHYCV